MMEWFKAHHIWTKLLALALAIALWAIVISSENPERTMDVDDAAVQLIGESTIRANYGLVVTNISHPEVSIRLKGTFSRLGEIEAGDVIVRADVSKFTVPGTFYLNYDVSVPNSVTVSSKTPERIQVTLDKIVEKELEVRVEYEGTLEEGLEIVEAVASPTKITVYGISSVMENAEYAVVKLNAGDLTENFSGDMEYYVADADGKRLDSEYTSSLTNTIYVEIPVYMTKTVPVTVEKKGNDIITEENILVEMFPETVSIYGEASAIREIEEICVGKIDVKDFVVSSAQAFPISLPEGVEFAGNPIKSVEANITLDGIQSSQISVTEFDLENVPADLNVTVETINIVVTVRGARDDLKDLSAEDFRISADLSNRTLSSGRQLAALSVECLREGVEVWGSYSVVINVSPK